MIRICQGRHNLQASENIKKYYHNKKLFKNITPVHYAKKNKNKISKYQIKKVVFEIKIPFNSTFFC